VATYDQGEAVELLTRAAAAMRATSTIPRVLQLPSRWLRP